MLSEGPFPVGETWLTRRCRRVDADGGDARSHDAAAVGTIMEHIDMSKLKENMLANMQASTA